LDSNCKYIYNTFSNCPFFMWQCTCSTECCLYTGHFFKHISIKTGVILYYDPYGEDASSSQMIAKNWRLLAQDVSFNIAFSCSIGFFCPHHLLSLTRLCMSNIYFVPKANHLISS
jgi:hypothetical protein